MSQKRVRTFILRNTVWHYELAVRIGGTGEQADKWAEKLLGRLESKPSMRKAKVAGRTYYLDGEPSHCMWFSKPPGAGMAAHEALHSVLHVGRAKGLWSPCESNDEAYCYLIQWTIAEIGKRLWM